ncbi:hypothetical protein CMQ_6169 [Grosmannia clavigera kw1407]|uniref:Uncharacterized protein n=1 Tax=Grosmannia clavigera (strain kw1407 / UAMH 11150) TaxID=655863 RepID=F0XM91_GROCL|nr:uncharacterized protein CMQ_6169 [Grosmannia clavigera kw1407]EFX01227.1 hypothetical protein CMQ_6169 [Grosmannia clavigera kw1407]
MEGILYIPPDRGTIIGRALWKARYVVVGPPREAKQKPSSSAAQFKPSAGQAPAPRATTPHSPPNFSPESMFISIYKNKDESEPCQQLALSSITECQVQMVTHRKQGPILPTLVITVSPDPVAEKLRKRRSSRSAGFASSKDATPNCMWFRPGDDNHHTHKHILQEWCQVIHSLLQQPISAPSASGTSSVVAGPTAVLSPITPATPTFTNPFASSGLRSREMSDPTLQQQQLVHRPGSDTHAARISGLSRKASNQTTQTYSSRERPATTTSGSPSLKSRRSDLSHASSTVPSHPSSAFVGSSNSGNSFALPMFQHRPAELPSPATTVGEFQGDFVEGWAPVQGRSSAVSSPIRGRESISSQTPHPSVTAPASAANCSSPAPRETILDRAFQMRFIPGYDREVPGEEKLSSLARFDALMREAEERRRLKQATIVADARAHEVVPAARPNNIAPKALKALDFIANHRSEAQQARQITSPTSPIAGSARAKNASYRRPMSRTGPADYDAQALQILNSGYHSSSAQQQLSRPQTGYARDRPTATQRTHSQPQLAALNTGSHIGHRQHSFLAEHPPSPLSPPSSQRPPEASSVSPTPTANDIRTKLMGGTVSFSSPLHRSATTAAATTSAAGGQPTTVTSPVTPGMTQSATNNKRLSFTDFTKRITTSTSSLLLLQTNASATGLVSEADAARSGEVTNARSSERGSLGQGTVHTRHHSISQVVSPPPPPPPPPIGDRCGWRGSVGVLNGEGGFS